jgi:type VI secretion system protein ImpE
MDAAERYRAGDLTKAIELANAAVREKPADLVRRGFLSEMLCFAGNLDRADAQLEIVANQSPTSAMGVSLLRQLIRAARCRQEHFQSGRVPDVLQQPDEPMRRRLEAVAAARAGDAARTAELLQAVEAGRGTVPGRMGGETFDDLRDLDDQFAGVFEVLTSTGKYYWVPTASVTRFAPRRPERPIDLLWLPVEMTVRDGPEGVVYMPTIYGDTGAADGDAQLLGRATDWIEGANGVVRGHGLRMFLVGGRDLSPFELGEILLGDAGAK